MYVRWINGSTCEKPAQAFKRMLLSTDCAASTTGTAPFRVGKATKGPLYWHVAAPDEQWGDQLYVAARH